jgi:imidazolonepropionase-like amidohydrolase
VPDNPTAVTIVNARVFDGSTVRSWTSVRFVDGMITGCSDVSLARHGDEVVDAHGATLLPGLIDSHVHLVPGALVQSLNFGVTTVLDMFSKPDAVTRARRQAAADSQAADVFSSGVGATAPGGHPSLMYAPFPTVVAAGEAELFVEDRVAEGADYLKIFSGVGGRWPSLRSETITALVTAAHARGLVVVAHVSSTADVEQVVAAGVDIVAHVPLDAELDPVLVRSVVEAGIAVGPTLATIENTIGGRAGPARPGMPPFSRALGAVRQLSEAGVVLLAGTDAPNPGTEFGESLHRELELLVRSGLNAERALAAATSEPARAFGLADRGRIRAGLRADLLLVSGDPLADISATRAIERIWRAGVACQRYPFVPDAQEVELRAAFDARVAGAVSAVRDRGRLRSDPRRP